MLIGSLGIRLVLWVGKVVPLPASLTLSQALTRVEITDGEYEGAGFQLSFTLSPTLAGEYDLLRSGELDVWNRVVIGVLLGATPQVLIDGVITHHQLLPSDKPGASTLTVTGSSLSLLLDLQEVTQSYPNQTDSVIALRVLGGYVDYGLLPVVTPTSDVPLAVDRTPWQSETDLHFLRRLSARNGFVFYIEPVSFGVNRAYFGPDDRLSVPQPALTLNMGSLSNTQSLRFAYDATLPTSVNGSFYPPGSPFAVPIPDLPLLPIPPMAMLPAAAKRRTLLRHVANMDMAQAMQVATAAKLGTTDAVTAEGEVDIARYGAVLQARRMVGVRGVGFSYDGFYYVKRVTHNIERGSYTQSFALSREGLGSLTQVVMP